MDILKKNINIFFFLTELVLLEKGLKGFKKGLKDEIDEKDIFYSSISRTIFCSLLKEQKNWLHN